MARGASSGHSVGRKDLIRSGLTQPILSQMTVCPLENVPNEPCGNLLLRLAWPSLPAAILILCPIGPELAPGWHFVDSTHVKVHADGSNPAGGQA
jgi:hypothetical protein